MASFSDPAINVMRSAYKIASDEVGESETLARLIVRAAELGATTADDMAARAVEFFDSGLIDNPTVTGNECIGVITGILRPPISAPDA